MKDWTFEEAQAAQSAYVGAGGDDNDPAGPLYQWVALQKIDELQAAYEAGDTFSLLDAVAQCALRELVMPDWVIRGYLDRYRSVTQYKVRTLDEAFGAILPKGAKLPARRQAREKGLRAYHEVERQHKPGTPIDQGLFESVGKDIGISGSKVRDYYYAYKNAWSSK
jgi:hypothetical protein